MTQARALTAEILDTLEPGAPEAVASRGDLRRINALMLQPRILAGLLRRQAGEPPRRVLELGCGDGHLTLALARMLAPDWPGVHLTLVDAQPVVSKTCCEAIERLGWTVSVQTRDVLDCLADCGQQDVIFCNLFLHHFEAEALQALLTAIAATSDGLVATEPRRGAIATAFARFLPIIGANAVTRHDARASVRAGFRAGELAAHWPGRTHIDRAYGPFTHAYAASSS